MFLFRKKGKRQKDVSSINKTESQEMNEIKYLVANLQGIGQRERQEDSFATANVFDVEKIRKQGLFFAVCDGIGGMNDGFLASKTAIQSIRESFQKIDTKNSIANQLKESMHLASERVASVLNGYGGSTAVAGIIYNDDLYYASVGDSFLYLKRGDNIYKINKEHNVRNKKYLSCVREGNLNPNICRDNIESAYLTQYIGMCGKMEVDSFVFPLHVRAGDVIMVCSDGIGGVLDENELKETLSLNDPYSMCGYIEGKILAYNRKNQDNYTAIIIQRKE